MKRLLASVLSAAASVAITVGICVYVRRTYTGLDLAGQPDNAPVRAAGLILFIFVPAALVLSAAYFPVVSWLLRKAHRLSLPAFSAVAFALSVTATVVAAVLDHEAGEAGGQFTTPFLFGLLVLASLLFGSSVWWLLTRPKTAA